MPFHTSRQWAEPATLTDLETLTEYSWCSCSAWRWGGLLLLNDQTSPDGAFEVSVVREADSAVMESLTVSWMDADRLRACLASCSAPDAPTYGTAKIRPFHPAGEPCRLCA